MGKIVNMNGEEIELISEYEALTYFKGRRGKLITLRSFREKVRREQIRHTKTRGGNRWFDKRTLLGLDQNTAA